MKSKTSFINKGILLNDCKLFGWISIAYLLGLLLTVPVKILMLFSQSKSLQTGPYTPTSFPNSYLQLFRFDSPWQIMLFVLVPVLTGLLLFRYLQSSHATDMNHALPIKRETMYNTHLTSGIIFLFVPIIITALVSLAILGGLGIESVSGKDVFIWLGISLLINLLLFITSVATGMITGMSSVQGVLTYILLLLPAALSVLFLHNLEMYLYGFAFDYYAEGLASLSPLIRLAEYPHQLITGTEVIVYLLVTLLLCLTGRFLYQRRKLEMASNAITFDVLRPVFKYGVTLCAMLLLGSYFNEAQNSIGWTIFGYIVGSFLGYFLSEILLNKSLSVFNIRKLRGYALFALAMILVVSTINYDLAGYEKRIPALEEIQSVYFDNSYGNLNADNRQESYPEEIDLASKFYQTKKLYSEADSISSIYALQEKIVANRELEKNQAYDNSRYSSQRDFCFAYQLKNGKMIYRQYSIMNDDLYKAELKPICESKEYRQLNYFILNTNSAHVDMLEISANEINKSVKLTDPVLINQAISALKKDALEQSYEEMTVNKPAWASINILFNNKESMDISWDKSDVNFGNWLKSIEKYGSARLMPDEIEYAIVEKALKNEPLPPDKYGPTRRSNERFADIVKTGKGLKITDPAQLEICLQNYTYEDDSNYHVFFMLKNGNSVSGGFSEQSIPDFAKN